MTSNEGIHGTVCELSNMPHERYPGMAFVTVAVPVEYIGAFRMRSSVQISDAPVLAQRPYCGRGPCSNLEGHAGKCSI